MKKLIFALFFVALAALPFAASAQQTNTTAYCQQLYGSNFVYNGSACVISNGNLSYTPLEPIPGVTTGFDPTNPANLPILINAVFKILFTLGAFLAVTMLVVGGIQYMTSEAVGNKKRGLDRAKAALYGMLLLAGAWLILNTINPQLLQFNLNPCPAGSGGCTVNSTPGTNSTSAAGTVAQGGDCSGGASCASGSYCAQEANGYGSQASVCLPTSNQAPASCNSSGGTWTTSVAGNAYCWLNNQTTEQSCEAAGGTWQSGWTLALTSYCTK